MPGSIAARLRVTEAPGLIDHGAITSVQQSFSNDSSVNQCLARARQLQDSILPNVQKASPDRTDDTVGLGVIAPRVRACGARFMLANTPADSDELDSLFQLALYEQNDALAQAIVPKLLSVQKLMRKPAPGGAKPFLDRDSGDVYARVLQSYLNFGRLAAASALMTQLNAQRGSSYYFFRLAYHFERLSRDWWRTPRDYRKVLVDIEDVLQLTEAREAQIDSTQLDERTYTLQWFALADLGYALRKQQVVDSVIIWAFATRAKRDLSRYVYATENLHFSYYPSPKDPCKAGGHWNNWENMTIPQLLNDEGFGNEEWSKRWPSKVPPALDTVWPDSTCIPYGILHQTPPPFPKS